MANKRPITTPANLAELPNTDSLIAGQSAVLVEQASSPGTPSSGFGIIYAKTDGKLYFKNDAGVETDLTAAGGGTDPIVREYIANGTWYVPTSSNFNGVFVLCIGAGGGGGSGRRGLASTTRMGGSGGGGGAAVYRFVTADQLAGLSDYAITIGSGGSAGGGITGDNLNGRNGGTGGDTSFGSWVIAKGGLFGSGGAAGPTNIAGGTGGVANNCTPARLPFAVPGGQGGTSFVSSGAGISQPGYNSTASLVQGPAGGAAGGTITSTNSQYNGGSGAGVYDVGTLITGPAAGVVSGGAGGNGTNDDANNILFNTQIPTTYGVGTGGGGGAAGDTSGFVAGGKGGNGGRCCGGAGGGSSTNGANSGAGGTGGDGLCLLIEYYGA